MTRTRSDASATKPRSAAAPDSQAPWPRTVVGIAAVLAAGASLLHWAGVRTLAHDLTPEIVYAVAAASALMGVSVLVGAEPWRSLQVEPGMQLARRIFLAGLGVAGVAAVVSGIGALPYPDSGDHAGHAVTTVADGDVREWIRLGLELLLVVALGWLAIRASGPGPDG